MGSKKSRRRARKQQPKQRTRARTIQPKSEEDYAEWWLEAYYGFAWGVGEEKIRPIADSIFGAGYYCVGDRKKATAGEVQNKGMQE